MADLHEELEQRERRSRLVSFLIGSAIILAIVVGVVWFNNRNDSGEIVDEGVNITASEDSYSSDADGSSGDGDSAQDSDSDSNSDSNDTDSSAATGDNEDNNTINSTADASDETTGSEDSDSVSEGDDTDDEQQAVATTGGGDNTEGELPNTGPEHAVAGLIGVIVAARLFAKTRSNLDSTLQG